MKEISYVLYIQGGKAYLQIEINYITNFHIYQKSSPACLKILDKSWHLKLMTTPRFRHGNRSNFVLITYSQAEQKKNAKYNST